mgnify:CR=1 FL=1
MPADTLPDTTPVPLSLANIDALPGNVARPRHSRESLSAGILHFGPGNFHRAHQQVYLDTLMGDGDALDWAVVGASVMPADAALRDTLVAQDLLGTVVSRTADTSDARVTGAMIDYLPPGDVGAILAALADPAIRIVSTTVTEGGYFVDADTGRFDDRQPAIREDAANPDAPKTVFGLIVRALAARRDADLPAFTVMSCDNLPHNGAVARGAVVGLARLIDPALADWIERNASFPNGMVDRIAPATGDRERRLVREEHGVEDGAPVFCEDYLQWVLEDKFVAGRPALEKVGVEFVDDVAPFETMKIRILNGGHALIAYPAGLLDIEFAHEAMQDPDIVAYLEQVERTEIVPIVPPVPGTDLDDYLNRVTTRFANPKIADTVRRLCFDGSNRQPKFVVPSVRDRLAADAPVDGLALGSALWCRYCYGETESGTMIRANDPSWDRLVGVAHEARKDPAAWLAMRDVYGTVGEDERFGRAFSTALEALWRDGTRAVLRDYTGAG